MSFGRSDHLLLLLTISDDSVGMIRTKKSFRSEAKLTQNRKGEQIIKNTWTSIHSGSEWGLF